MKISGREQHLAHLARLTDPQAIADVGKALFVAGSAIATDAAISITTGSVGGKNHVPSLPGQPPNADTGQLDREIEVTQPGPLSVEVAAYSPHAAPLEFGTATIAERPFMRPAAKKNRRQVVELVRDAVNRAVNR